MEDRLTDNVDSRGDRVDGKGQSWKPRRGWGGNGEKGQEVEFQPGKNIETYM